MDVGREREEWMKEERKGLNSTPSIIILCNVTRHTELHGWTEPVSGTVRRDGGEG